MTSDLRQRASELGTDVRRLTSEFRALASNFELQTSDLKLQTLAWNDIRHCTWISDFRLPMSKVRRLTSDVRCQMFDVRYPMFATKWICGSLDRWIVGSIEGSRIGGSLWRTFADKNN